jgi:hypothetical protein
MLILTVITALLGGGTLWAAIVYGRRNAKLAHESNQLARERSVVRWQAGRWDKANAGRLYVANVGEDTAHAVTVVASDGHDTVTREADRVPPYRPDDDALSEPPCYLDFLLEHRAANGPDPTRAEKEVKPVMPPEGSRFQEDFQERYWRPYEESIAREERNQVTVRIAWRSERGRWSTETLTTG